MQPQVCVNENPFAESHERFLEMLQTLQTSKTKAMTMGELESHIEVEGREVLRTMLEEHIRFRGSGDVGPQVEGKDGVVRTHRRERAITVKTIFGEISVERMVYSAPGCESLVPKDAQLNLPENCYSHGLQRRLSQQSAKGSFDEATEVVKSQTGVEIPKRQAEEIVRQVAQDFDAFYKARSVTELRRTAKQSELVVLTTDAKGIVMRKQDLREATKKRAENSQHKLKTRLSKGEKANAKRLAQVASVYSIDRHERTAEDIIAGRKSDVVPKPQGKRVWASLAQEPRDVIAEMFDEAERRDPKGRLPWCILVDGQPHQLELVKEALKKQGVMATIIVDIVHVIEYLWRACRDFFAEGSAEGEQWVSRYLRMVLEGKAKLAAAAIRRSATRQGKEKRENADECADYLHNKAPYLRYDEYLAAGMPIGTGVIEGACRHLVKDRMDITGARWSLAGAESVLRARSLYASRDWEEYWRHHERADYERNHSANYAYPQRLSPPSLKVVH